MQPGSSFEPLPGARHRIEIVDGVEWIVIPAIRRWFVLPFLSVWLVLWTFGGIAAFTTLLTGTAHDRAFLAVWLIFWAAGWFWAATSVSWQLAGRHLLAVSGGALLYRWSMPLLSKTRRYDASQVRKLRSTEGSSIWPGGMAMRLDHPPFMPMQDGTVRFDYGARTIRLVPALDQAEGQMIVDRLVRRLPGSAV